MWLDPPVISRDGDTLSIVREAHWDFAEWALCVVMAGWVAGWILVGYPWVRPALLGLPHPLKGQTDAVGSAAWVLAILGVLFFILRMILFGGETISIDPSELQISNKWAGRWRTRQYLRPAACDVVMQSEKIKRGYRYWLGFDYQGKCIWAKPSDEEFEIRMMLDALQEHLARQQVQ